MKSLASIILLSIFFMIGCQDDSSLLEPSNSFSDASPYNKGRVILPKFITLPEEEGLAKISETSDEWVIEEYVKCDEDAELIIDQSYKGGIHGEVTIISKLKIYAGTMKEDSYITMYVSKVDGTVSIKSSQPFNDYAELYLKYDGIDLEDESSYDISYGYITEDISLSQAQYNEINFEKSNGTLELKEGMISQFGRYGFTTTK